jgi:lambda repressor-like predicted transcriptional regulator
MKEARDILAEALGTVAPQQMWPVRGVREVDDATFADSILAALSEKGWTLAPEGLDAVIEQVRTMPPNGVISRWENVSRSAVIDLLLAARGRETP